MRERHPPFRSLPMWFSLIYEELIVFVLWALDETADGIDDR